MTTKAPVTEIVLYIKEDRALAMCTSSPHVVNKQDCLFGIRREHDTLMRRREQQCRCLSTFPSLTVWRICENNEPKQNLLFRVTHNMSRVVEKATTRQREHVRVSEWLGYRLFTPMLRERFIHAVVRHQKATSKWSTLYLLLKRISKGGIRLSATDSASVSGASLILQVERFYFLCVWFLSPFLSQASLVLWAGAPNDSCHR